MRPRIQLNPKALEHFRERLGLSQKQVAECLRKRVDQKPESLIRIYQRIERTGITSPKTAEKLAVRFTVSVAQLQGELAEDKVGYFWLIDSENEGPGILHHRMELLWELSMQIGLHDWSMNQANVHAQVISERRSISLILPRRHTTPEGMLFGKWTIKAARYTEAGIMWVSFTEYELEALTVSLRQLAFGVADCVSVDDEQYPSDAAEMCYSVVRYSPESQESYQRCFSTSARVREHLVRQMREQPRARVNIGLEDHVCVLNPIGGSSRFSISRAYRTAGDADVHDAPWRSTARREFRGRLHDCLTSAFDDGAYSLFN